MTRSSKYPNVRRPNARSKSAAVGPSSFEGYWRANFLQICVYLALAGLFVRLFDIQVLKHDKFRRMAEEQYNIEYKQLAPRGLIFDRKGTALAFNRTRYDLGIDKRQVENRQQLAARLAPIIHVSKGAILNKLSKPSAFVPLTRGINDEQAKVIEIMRLPGVKITRSSERIYPFKEKLAQVIGFAGIDGNGLSGIELQFDHELRGKDGWGLLQKDARGRSLMQISEQSRPSQSGGSIILTVDQVTQTIVEEELELAVASNKARGGTAIVIDPRTGEILAVASAPNFDANNAGNQPENWKVRAITDIFEPGSTFKIVTMMAALIDTVMKMDDIIFCENGKYKLHGEVINDSEPHGWLTFHDVFVLSSNIGTAKIAQEVRTSRLFQIARDLGFGNKTGVELPGEVSGILKKPSDWSRFTPAAMSYGHEVAATVLQMAMAYGAIANGGMLMKPTIIKEIKDNAGNTRMKFEPQIIRQAIEPRIAQKMTDILIDVVEDGTGKQARIEGLRIAGKTGTAQKPLKTGGYSSSKYVASFVGFYPAEQARLLIYVAIDEPTPVHYGGYTAAPAVRKMLERILKVEDKTDPVQPAKVARTMQEATEYIPDLKDRDLGTAKRILEELNVDYEVVGAGDIVLSQEVVQPANHKRGDQIRLTAGEIINDSEYVVMPKLVGMSVRKAIAELSLRGLEAKIEGSGKVVRQQPEAESKLRVGARCYLECRPVMSVQMLAN